MTTVTTDYKSRPFPDHRCTDCRNVLPTNDAGYCWRCDTGWKLRDLSHLSDDLIEREIGLAAFARDTFESRGRMDQGGEMDVYIANLRKELERR